MTHEEPTTPEVVWNAYQSLHRYVRWPADQPRLGQLPPTDGAGAAILPALHPSSLIPTRLGPYSACSPNTKAAAGRAAMSIHVERTVHPIPDVGALEYAYWYLFAQLLRISFPFNPEFINAGTGWVRLRWIPFASLIGRADNKAPGAYWQRWYTDNWVDQAPETRLQNLRTWYPLLLDTEHAQHRILERQCATLHRLQAEHHCSAAAVVEQFDATGQPSGIIHTANTEWHPAIKASLWERWEPAADGESLNLGDVAVRTFVRQLIAERPRTVLQFFGKTLPQILPDVTPEARQIIFDGFEDVVRRAEHIRLESRWASHRRLVESTFPVYPD